MRDTARHTNTIDEEAQDYYDRVFDHELKELLDQADNGDDEAYEQLDGMAYGIQKRVTYYVTLAGGGPAARLAVEVDDDGNIEDARFEYQDWFTPWTPAPKQDPELVERLAQALGGGIFEG